jgi:hypothetical protein
MWSVAIAGALDLESVVMHLTSAFALTMINSVLANH